MDQTARLPGDDFFIKSETKKILLTAMRASFDFHKQIPSFSRKLPTVTKYNSNLRNCDLTRPGKSYTSADLTFTFPCMSLDSSANQAVAFENSDDVTDCMSNTDTTDAMVYGSL
jgi:hypothetical protein